MFVSAVVAFTLRGDYTVPGDSTTLWVTLEGVRATLVMRF